MKQEFKKLVEEQKSDDLLAEFHQVKKTRQKRTVYLWYEQGCGCGGASDYIRREVELDSPLQNGDEMTDFEADDIQVSRSEYRDHVK